MYLPLETWQEVIELDTAKLNYILELEAYNEKLLQGIAEWEAEANRLKAELDEANKIAVLLAAEAMEEPTPQAKQKPRLKRKERREQEESYRNMATRRKGW